MLAIRAFTFGVFAASTIVLASLSFHAPASPPRRAPEIVDVAHGVSMPRMLGLVRLAADERIVAIDDRPVGCTIAEQLVAVELRSRTYVDVDVAGEHGMRRVLLLIH